MVRAPTQAGRFAERRGGPPRRRRLRSTRLLRFRCRHTQHRPARIGGPAIQPVPCDSAVLTEPSVAADRPQSSRRRDGVLVRHRHGLPGVHDPDPEVGSDHCPRPSGRRVQHDGRRQMAHHPASRPDRRRAIRSLAPWPRVRPLLRIPPRRRQPLDPDPRLRQPLHRRPRPPGGRAIT